MQPFLITYLNLYISKLILYLWSIKNYKENK